MEPARGSAARDERISSPGRQGERTQAGAGCVGGHPEGYLAPGGRPAPSGLPASGTRGVPGLDEHRPDPDERCRDRQIGSDRPTGLSERPCRRRGVGGRSSNGRARRCELLDRTPPGGCRSDENRALDGLTGDPVAVGVEAVDVGAHDRKPLGHDAERSIPCAATVDVRGVGRHACAVRGMAGDRGRRRGGRTRRGPGRARARDRRRGRRGVRHDLRDPGGLSCRRRRPWVRRLRWMGRRRSRPVGDVLLVRSVFSPVESAASGGRPDEPQVHLEATLQGLGVAAIPRRGDGVAALRRGR